MHRLLEIGFQPAGHWHLLGDQLAFELLRHGSQHNILYAFVSDGVVKYVGKTGQPLRKRMYGYQNPGDSQVTNVRNNARIAELLRQGEAVDILALPDNGLLHYGQFHLNLAAGLEDSIISVLQPEWNGRPRDSLSSEEQLEEEEQPTKLDSLVIVLHETYYRKGFFNVPVDHSQSFGDDGQQIELFCGDAATPVLGSINRRANLSNSPRIMGGTSLRDWFQGNFAMMQEIRITVYSKTSIRIHSSNE